MDTLQQFKLLQQFDGLRHGISNRHTEAAAISTAQVQAEQIHGHGFGWVTESAPHTVRNVDALLTSESGIVLRVGVSDCTPIVVYDSSVHSGGVVHAGFKGTSQNILQRVLEEFNPATSYVGIGPAIGDCCYDDIHIQEENYIQALNMGVPEHHIEVIPQCTKCNSDTYYSYRSGDRVNFGIYLELL